MNNKAQAIAVAFDILSKKSNASCHLASATVRAAIVAGGTFIDAVTDDARSLPPKLEALWITLK